MVEGATEATLTLSCLLTKPSLWPVYRQLFYALHSRFKTHSTSHFRSRDQVLGFPHDCYHHALSISHSLQGEAVSVFIPVSASSPLSSHGF